MTMMMMCDEFEVGRGERPSSSSGGTQKVLAALSLSFSVFFFFSVKSKGMCVRVLLFRRKESNTKRSSTRDKALRDESRVLFSLVSFFKVFFPN